MAELDARLDKEDEEERGYSESKEKNEKWSS